MKLTNIKHKRKKESQSVHGTNEVLAVMARMKMVIEKMVVACKYV